MISIIIPAYNCEKYITATINSVLAQTHTDWECIVVDDCSTDNTAKVIKSFKDKRIKYFKTPNNMGAFGARNIGIEKSTGRFIAFLDADDIWYKDKLKIQYDFMQKNKCDVSTHGYNYIDENDNIIKGDVYPLDKFTVKSYMGNTCINMDTVMLNVKTLGKVYFKNEPKREDCAYWIDILGNGGTILGIKQIFASYRIHGGQVSGNKIEMALRTFKLYMKQPYVNKLSAAICFIKYAINAVLKRV